MATATSVPIIIDREAAAQVAELGMQAEFEQMLEHTRQTVPELRRIEVILVPAYDTDDDAGIVIQAMRCPANLNDDATQREWGSWKVTTFSPDVCRHFVMWVVYETADAG
jgi:hypothetical protein